MSFTCGFDLASASGLEIFFDERERAEALSHQYGTELYEVVIKSGDLARALPSVVWHLEDLRVGQSYPNFYIARLASKFVKVVLSGIGGDEIFGGYPWRYYVHGRAGGYEDYVRSYFTYWQRLVPPEVTDKFFAPAFASHVREIDLERIFRSALPSDAPSATMADFINQSLYLECKTFLHGLLVVEDRLNMAHGLEARVPFLDNDLVDFAMSIPLSCKLREWNQSVTVDENQPGDKTERYFQRTADGKLLLRKVMGRYMPEEYASGKKQGFSAPDASWFRGESVEYVRMLLAGKETRIYEYLDATTVGALLDDHMAGRQNRRLLIWSLLCFEWWLRLFFP